MALKKRHIVHLAARYSPSLGGVETHLKKINEVFLRDGFVVTVITTQHDKELSLKEKINGVQVVRIPFEFSNQKIKTWKWIRQHKNIFNDAIIHVHDVSWWLIPVLPSLFKIFFITNHGWEGVFPVPFSNKLQRLIFSFCAKKTIHVGEYIQHFYWDKPTTVIYGGVEKVKNVASRHSRENIAIRILKTLVKNGTKAVTGLLGKKKVKFVFVGRLEKENDIEKYLEFLEIFKEKYNVDVTWVGDGKYADACAEFGKVTGMVTNVAEYISPADFVFASSYLSILQAQVQGKIVISFYSHQLKQKYLQLFPGSTWMLIESDSILMKESVKALLKDGKRYKNLSLEAEQFAKTQSWEKVARVYQEIWN